MNIRHRALALVRPVWAFLQNRKIPEASSAERREKQQGEEVKQARKRYSMGIVTASIKEIAEPKNAWTFEQS
jgi:hypothetical protein